MKVQKKELILQKIQADKYAKVSDLETEFSIPRTSLLRYLAQLEEEGKIIKSFGEVKIRYSHQETHAFPRIKDHIQEKIILAKKAAKLIEDKDVIFLDGGSTTYYLAQELRERDIKIYTNNFLITSIIDGDYKPTIAFIPGTLNKITLVSASSASILYLSKLEFDKAFIGFNSYINNWFSTTNEEEAILKETVIKQTNIHHAYALGRTKKADKKAKYAFANTETLKLII